MGHLDEAGYLFISGRSKEIINRGGETISPFEIEEVLVKHPYIKECIAFSAPSEEYQEVVGAVIVSKEGKPRVDLLNLHKYLDGELHRSKWPQILVYMNALPKNNTGKLLRIKLADRLQLVSVDEKSLPVSRLLEATCPVVGAALTEKIPNSPVNQDLAQIESLLLKS